VLECSSIHSAKKKTLASAAWRFTGNLDQRGYLVVGRSKKELQIEIKGLSYFCDSDDCSEEVDYAVLVHHSVKMCTRCFESWSRDLYDAGDTEEVKSND